MTKKVTFKDYILPFGIVFLILIIDQIIKIWIKTHMYIGQEYHIFGNWFIIHFTENNGMAFGLEFAGGYGKLFLSLFRIIAVVLIIWYLYTLIRDNAGFWLKLTICLILAGAVGNIIDSAFYGMIFNESNFQIATLFPSDNAVYGTFLHGKVVDMFYFPILEGHYPQWFPFWGGEEFIFFRPVFNFADSSITIGIILLLIFQKKFFPKKQ